MPVLLRPKSFHLRRCLPKWIWGITRRFHRLSPGRGLVAYALRTRAPLSLPRRGDPVRLACIRPAASVHPEPGSNSSLYYCCTFLFPVLGLRYDSLFLTGGPRLLGGPARLLASYAGLKLSKNCSTFPLCFPSSVRSKTAAKVQPFFILASLFSLFFQKIFSTLIISLLEIQKNSHTLYKVWLFGIVSVL